MKKVPYWLLLLAVTTSGRAYSFGPEMDRSLVSSLDNGEIELWGQLDHFNKAFDLLDYHKKASSTSTLEHATNLLAGLNAQVSEPLTLRYRYKYSDSAIDRVNEPFRIEGDSDGHDLRIQTRLLDAERLSLSLEAGLRVHEATPNTTDQYRSGSTLFFTDGSGVTPSAGDWSVSSDYLLKMTAKDEAVLLGMQGSYQHQEDLRINSGFEVREVEIEARSYSSLFETTDPVVVNDSRLIALKAELPQQTPWEETHWLLHGSVDWRFAPEYSTTWGVTHYKINRRGYEPRSGREDYSRNTQLDGYLFWYPKKNLSLYAHGRAYTNYLLGDQPLAYSRRVSHLYKHPYGYLSAGLVYRF